MAKSRKAKAQRPVRHEWEQAAPRADLRFAGVVFDLLPRYRLETLERHWDRVTVGIASRIRRADEAKQATP